MKAKTVNFVEIIDRTENPLSQSRDITVLNETRIGILVWDTLLT